jgi:hypothetical protein
LTENGIFENCENPKGVGYVFKVPEESKRRWRVVHDTLSSNVLLGDAPNPRFQKIRAVQDLVHKGEWGVSADWKAFYYQIPMAECVRDYFAIRVGDKFYRPTRLPMGFKWSVFIAQLITAEVVKRVRVLHSDVYVDNVLCILKTESEAKKVKDTILRVCADMGITVGDIQVGRKLIHRGMELDFEHKSVRIAERFTTKLKERALRSSGSWGEVRSLISMVVYGMQILRIPLGRIFHVFKFWGRNALTDPRKCVAMWSAAQKEFQENYQMLIQNTAVLCVGLEENNGPFLITDATMTSIAGVVIYRGEVLSYSQGTEVTPIAANEALAVAKTVTRWLHLFGRKRITIMGDNIVVLCALARGMSMDFLVNVRAVEVIRRLTAIGAEMRLVYVRSDENVADPLTRGRQWTRDNINTIELLRLSTLRAPTGVVSFLSERLFEKGNLPILKWKR